MTRLVQLRRGQERRVALVDEPRLRLLGRFDSVFSLAQAAIALGESLSALARAHAGDQTLDYDAVYEGRDDWRLLVPLDHPDEPARCLVTGTGLTHLGSARDRDAMHGVDEAQLTDSMRMFRSGLEGGRPAEGAVGVAPEWFYKGCGTTLRAHGEPLEVPAYAEDGGEEAEVAGAYLITPDGRPWRVGLCAGNEFSDHVFERRNYLNLAGSKLRTCALGPELVVGAAFDSVRGEVAVERGGATLWDREIRTGEAEMSHSLRNIEHHHFKFAAHRRPGDVHVHYLGACALSFGDGVRLAEGDVMRVAFDGFGRPLRNPVLFDESPDLPVTVESLA
jgi:hypothetical protein